ncbi:MAG TPA: hypothetical protein PLY35_13435, partial [Thermotogota bacterium]|nr:hypothetical protein [Thermotogota bacterium]
GGIRMKKRYDIQGVGQVYVLELSGWQKTDKIRVYMKMSKYGDLGYYDAVADQYVASNKEWERIERKAPEMADQIKKAVQQYAEGM